MRTNDYRNTDYCPILDDVAGKKKVLEEKIRKAHPRQKIMYNKVHDRDTSFNKEFCTIYNCKCSYCGVSMEILPATLFEVDHFVAESLFEEKEKAGEVNNLVLACYQCNRNKKAFEIRDEYIKMLNVDDGEITKVFFRDDKYYIRIEDAYVNDKVVGGFYNQLQLINQTRRLDYLLSNMQGLHKKLEGTAQGCKLAEAIVILQRKRNKFLDNE